MSDTSFHVDDLGRLDPDVAQVIQAEQQRQDDKLILIPSESLTPRAVREALGSVFTSLYAEGYPSSRMRQQPLRRLLDLEEDLAYHYRYSDRRYYKGTEFADVVETLAQRRVATLFATVGQAGAEVEIPAEAIYANVQPLSGAAANNAVFEALLRPGETLMGMDLNAGGHLTHGSPVNRSGKYYKVVSYGLDDAGRIDYEQIARLAQEHEPRLIIAGATAYPWHIDWRRLREIADSLPDRAYLMADISHPAGLVVAGLFPNPIGFADVVTFTTHKTLLGPRAAVILTTDPALATKVDRAVFPGEQGGPHMNQVAAMAVAFQLAATPEFRRIQQGIVDNAVALAGALQKRGLTLVGGGTETHLLLIDLNKIKTTSGLPVKGDVGARILDTCGLVCNRNTIPGDVSSAQASGLRLGTVWLTQRGFGAAEMERIAELIYTTLTSIESFAYSGRPGQIRGKVPISVLREVRHGVADLLASGQDQQRADTGQPGANVEQTGRYLEIVGSRAALFLQQSCASHLLDLAVGERRPTVLLNPDGLIMTGLEVLRLEDDEFDRQRYLLAVEAGQTELARDWLRALSDAYVLFDKDRIEAKVAGPVVVRELSEAVAREHGGMPSAAGAFPGLEQLVAENKPYFVGRSGWPTKDVKQECALAGYEGEPRPSALYDEHLKLNKGRNMSAFGGWLMPLWYTSITEEHRAVRETAALFDVTHMGTLEVSGPGAARFLDLVFTNNIYALRSGEAQYSYLLDPDARVLDDVFIYCLAKDRYLLVVNAANAEQDEAWLRMVNERRCLIDRQYPGIEVDATANISNLKDAASGPAQLVNIALQGPRSLAILQRVVDSADARRLADLGRSEFVKVQLGGIEALVSRTGYTGEMVGFEMYVHPQQAAELWRLLLERGAEEGIKPAGLGARDSARIEAGLPLYGHELAGVHHISPFGAGYGAFVKTSKPFFVGREPLLATEAKREQQIVRFATPTKGLRAIRSGDPVLNQRGQVIGFVTSSTILPGRQLGMAYVNRRYAEKGMALSILPISRGGAMAMPKRLTDLARGDEYSVPEPAVVLPRFGLQY